MTQLESDQHLACPACGQEEVDNSVEALDAVCESCGLVLDEASNSAVEWEITHEPFRRSKDEGWLSECHVRNATEQRLAEAFNTIEDLSDQLDFGDEIREETVEIYCDAFRSGVTDGRKTACVVAASLRLASRDVGCPVPMSRLIELPEVEETKCHSCHLAICDELNIEPDIPAPTEYLSFLQLQLVGLTDGDRQSVEQLLKQVKNNQAFVAKNPAGIAAAGVYVLQEDYTQREVAEAVGLATETVRQRVKQFRVSTDV